MPYFCNLFWASYIYFSTYVNNIYAASCYCASENMKCVKYIYLCEREYIELEILYSLNVEFNEPRYYKSLFMEIQTTNIVSSYLIKCMILKFGSDRPIKLV